MDQDRFDRIARALGAGATRREGLRIALGAIGLLGLGAAVPADGSNARRRRRNADAGHQKRRHACGADKPCPSGFSCQKVGKRRQCVCSTGVECSGACCAAGQTCVSGACADPGPGACIEKGQPCKNVGRRCCDGLSCASGQGGLGDVACYVAKTGACTTTADCAFGTACDNGRCAALPAPSPVGPVPNGGECADGGGRCLDPQATCTSYESGVPAGRYCLLADGKVCLAPSDCVSGVCNDGLCGGAVSDCDVCASGCPYATIQAAVADSAGKPADSTITIAPGTYVESIAVTRNLTFERCGDQGSVSWRGPSGAAIDGTAAPLLTQLTVKHIDFLVDGSGSSGAPAIKVGRSAFSSYLNTTISDCTFSTYSGRVRTNFPALQLGAQTDTTVIDSTFQKLESQSTQGSAITVISDPSVLSETLLDIQNCTFQENFHSPWGINPVTGGTLYVRGAAGARATVDITNSTFKKNESRKSPSTQESYVRGGAVAVQSFATVNINGTTVIEENAAGNTSGAFGTCGGGGIYAACEYNSTAGTVVIDIDSTVQIKTNVAQNGGGIGTNTTGCTTNPNDPAFLQVTGAAGATITGNVVGQCETTTDGTTWTSVTGCAF